MSTEPAAGIAARAHRAVETLHSLIYFAPEAEQEYTAAGLRPGRMGYFASRSAPMGAVSAGVTAATFYNFNPDLVARFIPRAWSLATPEAVLAARLTAVDRAYRRLFGADVDSSAEVAEAAQLVRAATERLDPAGRPLFAAHAGLAWPELPHLALWHGASLLREFRGDAHLDALLLAGLSGLEAIVTHTATGRGFTEQSAKALRGWSDEQWDDAVASLRARGLLGDDGLTEAGLALRERIETDTDRMDGAPWRTLGEAGTARLIELGKGLSQIAVVNGAFPSGVFAAR